MRFQKAARWLIISSLLAVFLCSTWMVAATFARYHSEQRAFEELALLIGAEDAKSQAPEGTESESPDIIAVTQIPAEEAAPSLSAYEALKEANEDFYGWISIEGTQIDYPVMFTPDDPEYYLRRAFDGSASNSGVPFLDAHCFAEGGNDLIYGHNMRNGTMFSTLLSYADQDFWLAHPTIQFDTLEGAGSYSVMAAFYTEITQEDGQGFPYYLYTDLRDAQDFNAYVGHVREAALYDTGITAEYGDVLLTLSTCSYHATGGRFVVVARKDVR